MPQIDLQAQQTTPETNISRWSLFPPFMLCYFFSSSDCSIHKSKSSIHMCITAALSLTCTCMRRERPRPSHLRMCLNDDVGCLLRVSAVWWRFGFYFWTFVARYQHQCGYTPLFELGFFFLRWRCWGMLPSST